MNRLLGLVLLGLLAGCANAPALHYYRLTDEPTTTSQTSSVEGSILISVKLPDYLNDRNIVYQGSDVTIEAARHNLWVEPPEQAITRRLRTELGLRQPHYEWLTPLGDGGPRSPVLLVVFDQFNGRFNGRAVLTGYWLLRDGRQAAPTTKPFQIEVRQQGNGYPALVRALNQGLVELANEIARQLPSPVFKTG